MDHEVEAEVMTMNTFNLPDLGEGLQDAEIVSWHVTAGDRVVADQPLVSVETDKAVVEVPSPQSGRISRLFGGPGDRVAVGQPLVEFDAAGKADAGTVVGKIQSPQAAPPTPKAAPAAAGKVKAAPAVRALAKKLNVDLSLVQATGTKGTVSREDVKRVAKTLAETGAAEPLRGVRRAMAEKMARAHSEVVPTTVVDEADIGGWAEDASVMARLIRAVAAGCGAAPALNAWYDGKEMSRRMNEKIDLGVAVNTREGLFVPVLHDIANREAQDLLAGLERMKEDVEARTVPPEELRGQTITLSNYGTIAGRYSAMVVIPPQVAILGAGRISERVVAIDGKPAVRRTLPLSLTFDHRAATGGEAAQFLAAAIDDLEKAE